MIQAARRHRNIHQRIPSGSEILDDISNVCRYQKYCVSDDFSHSVSTSDELKDDVISDTLALKVLVKDGHSDHGRVP